MKTIIFGDSSGHLLPLLNSLKKIGFNFNTLQLPQDIRVIHVGDLVNKGNDSNLLVSIVDRIMSTNRNWIQLFGNHELQYVAGGTQFWDTQLNDTSIATVNSWWDNQRAKLAYGLIAERMTIINNKKYDFSHPLLITHSGISYELFENLGATQDIRTLVHQLNDLSIHQAAQIDGMNTAWTTIQKLYSSWEDQKIGINQINGHNTPYDWILKEPYPNTADYVLDYCQRVSITVSGTSFQVGTDPGFSEVADLELQPYLTIK